MAKRKSLALAVDRPTDRRISTTPEIDRQLRNRSPVAFGLSGGKDSQALAIAGIRYLDKIGHRGPRLFVHADLGAVEWQDSLPACERTAKALGVELLTVRRPKGGMMERWEQRWDDNVSRWEQLECVKLILPWSTPGMRFCTSELKVDPICRALVNQWPGAVIVNATGIRAAESSERAKAPIAKDQPKLGSVRQLTAGMDWHPILTWTIPDVWLTIRESGIDPHEGYGAFGTSRVSCVACILATEADHQAAGRDERNHKVLRRMMNLESRSTFAFQGNRWLCDTYDHLLDDDRRAIRATVKANAALREAAEARLPKHLLYHKGWPTCVPTREEAALIADTRVRVGNAVGLVPQYFTPEDVRNRYAFLVKVAADRAAEKAKKTKP